MPYQPTIGRVTFAPAPPGLAPQPVPDALVREARALIAKLETILARFSATSPRTIEDSFGDLMELTAEAFNLSPVDITSISRERAGCHARGLLCHFLIQECGWTYRMCDRRFQKSTGSAAHIVRTVRERLKDDRQFSATAKQILGQFRTLQHLPPLA